MCVCDTCLYSFHPKLGVEEPKMAKMDYFVKNVEPKGVYVCTPSPSHNPQNLPLNVNNAHKNPDFKKSVLLKGIPWKSITDAYNISLHENI